MKSSPISWDSPYSWGSGRTRSTGKGVICICITILMMWTDLVLRLAVFLMLCRGENSLLGKCSL